MKAVILAGGVGSRMRGIVKDLPKPMVDIRNRPFLEYLILQLVKWNMKEIVLSVGHKKEAIESYFGDGGRWNVRIIYSEEEQALGTGGALRKAAGLVDDGEFLAMNGDSFFGLDFEQIIAFHRRQKAKATIGLSYVDDTSRYGKVEIDSKGEVVGFTEKGSPGTGFINGGVYVFCTFQKIDC